MTHVADLTDPLTGERTHFHATTADELDRLVEDHLAQAYPDTPDED